MQLDRLGTLCVTQPLMRGNVLRFEPGVAVLMYHSVSDDPEPGVAPYYRLATSPTRFRQHMQWLRDGGYHVVDLGEALRLLQAGQALADRFVVVTFDDGFRDFHVNAWPVLREFGFTATMFLPTAYIGNGGGSFKGRECLSWHDVRDLRAAGMSFGSHTFSHPVLHGLAWPALARELRDSRRQMEDALQAPVEAFSYPYAFPQEDADFVVRFRQELLDQGYTAAVTTVIGRAVAGSDPLCVKRLPVNDCDDEALFAGKLSGAYDWMGRVQSVFRRAKRSTRARTSA